MKLSECIWLYRKEKKLSLREFADLAHCSHQYISKLEKEEIDSPSVIMMDNLAKAMGKTLSQLREEINCSEDNDHFLTQQSDLERYKDIYPEKDRTDEGQTLFLALSGKIPEGDILTIITYCSLNEHNKYVASEVIQSLAKN